MSTWCPPARSTAGAKSWRATKSVVSSCIWRPACWAPRICCCARETGDLANLHDEVGNGYGNNGDIMVSHNTAEPVGTQQSLLAHDQPGRPRRSRQSGVRQHVLATAAAGDERAGLLRHGAHR